MPNRYVRAAFFAVLFLAVPYVHAQTWYPYNAACLLP